MNDEGKLTLSSEECPYCGANLLACKIPEKDRKYYGNGRYFYRTISIYSTELDRTVAIACPDCGAQDER